MKRLGSLLWLGVFAWAVSGSVWAREVTLRYNYIPGESRTYGLGVTGTGTASLAGISAPLEFSATSAMTQVCKRIADDGAMEIEMVSSPASVSASFAGMPVEVGNLPTEETRMSLLLYPDGRVEVGKTLATDVLIDAQGNRTDTFGAVETPSLSGGPLGFLGVEIDPYQVARSAATTVLPEGPLAEGSTWTRKVEVPLPGGKSGELTATSTLSGFQEAEGIDCAVIDTEFSLPLSLEFPGLGIALDGWAAGKIREVATVEQMKTVEQAGNVSLSLSSATPGEDETTALLGPGLLSNISVTVEANFNTYLQE